METPLRQDHADCDNCIIGGRRWSCEGFGVYRSFYRPLHVGRLQNLPSALTKRTIDGIASSSDLAVTATAEG